MQFLDDILIGSGEKSENLCQIITLPSSRPHNIECIQDSENQLSFKWDEPLKIAPDVEVDNYNFKLVKGKTHHELTAEATTTELSTESSKQPESNMGGPIPTTAVPNSRLNPIPIPETYSPERPKIFSRFLEFLDFLSFARRKKENVVRISKEATTGKNVDGKKFVNTFDTIIQFFISTFNYF